MNTDLRKTPAAPTPVAAAVKSIIDRSWPAAVAMALSLGAFVFRILRKFWEDVLTNDTGYAPGGIPLIEDLIIAAIHLVGAALLVSVSSSRATWHPSGRTFAAVGGFALAVAITLPWLMSTASSDVVRPIDLANLSRANSDAGVLSTPLLLAAVASFVWAAIRSDQRANTVGIVMAACAVGTAGVISLDASYDGQHLGPGWWLSATVIVTICAASWIRKFLVSGWTPRTYVSPNVLCWLLYAVVTVAFIHAMSIPTPEPATGKFDIDTSSIENALKAVLILYQFTIGMGLFIASITRGTWLRFWVVSGALLPILVLSAALLLEI